MEQILVSIESMLRRITINNDLLYPEKKGTSAPFFFYFSQLDATIYQ